MTWPRRGIESRGCDCGVVVGSDVAGVGSGAIGAEVGFAGVGSGVAGVGSGIGSGVGSGTGRGVVGDGVESGGGLFLAPLSS